MFIFIHWGAFPHHMHARWHSRMTHVMWQTHRHSWCEWPRDTSDVSDQETQLLGLSKRKWCIKDDYIGKKSKYKPNCFSIHDIGTFVPILYKKTLNWWAVVRDVNHHSQLIICPQNSCGMFEEKGVVLPLLVQKSPLKGLVSNSLTYGYNNEPLINIS